MSPAASRRHEMRAALVAMAFVGFDLLSAAQGTGYRECVGCVSPQAAVGVDFAAVL
jgi:hypothetical protein